MIRQQQKLLHQKDARIAELENYIDNLLVKVIDNQPQILTSEMSHVTSPGSSTMPRWKQFIKNSSGLAQSFRSSDQKSDEQSDRKKMLFQNPWKALRTALN